MYPAGSHLSASLYRDGLPEAEVFRAVCHVLGEDYGMPVSAAEYLTSDKTFTWLSELWPERDRYTKSFAPSPWSEGVDFERTPLRVRFDEPKYGPFIAAYSRGDPAYPHPMAVIFSDHVLGIPDDGWNASERREAYRLGAFSLGLFRRLCDRIDPLYGELSDESTMVDVKELLAGGCLQSGIYVSDRLLGAKSDSFASALAAAYDPRVATRWGSGWYVAYWAPINPHHYQVPDDYVEKDVTKTVRSCLNKYLAA